jgi:hypothetical protein
MYLLLFKNPKSGRYLADVTAAVESNGGVKPRLEETNQITKIEAMAVLVPYTNGNLFLEQEQMDDDNVFNDFYGKLLDQLLVVIDAKVRPLFINAYRKPEQNLTEDPYIEKVVETIINWFVPTLVEVKTVSENIELNK